MDELWSYVGKKQKRVTDEDNSEVGDQYVFVALGTLNKAIISYRVGKRDMPNTEAFARDLRSRVLGTPQVSSDAFPAYEGAIASAFDNLDYGQIVKSYKGEPPVNAARRYSPGWVVGVKKEVIFGQPTKRLICTSHIERENLNVRMSSRRFTWLSNGFSKKLANHEAAVALYVASHNLCRVHGTTRETPATSLGLTDHLWSIAELLDAALSAGGEDDEPTAPPPMPVMLPPVARRPQFTVIQGGRT